MNDKYVKLDAEQIRELEKVMTTIESSHSARIAMMERYEEIYFMTRQEKPKGLDVDDNDIKLTVSSSGRDAVTGLKRILDTSEIHIKVKGAKNSDKIEAGLKKMIEISGQYRMSSIEKDLNLSASLYGPAVIMAEEVGDLIYASDGKNEYVKAQLELIKEQTPFLFTVLNAKQSYPVWGKFGMIGHERIYTVKGNVLKEEWGVDDVKDDQDYKVKDLFYYEKRLVKAEGVNEPLLACEWVTRDGDGKIIGSISIPVFARYAGGSSLFHEPEKQMQPLLYAKAKGEWDLRENLFWTTGFTSMYTQGLPGPMILVDPENQSQEIKVNYQNGIRYMVAKGNVVNSPVISPDWIRMKEMMDREAATQTVQPQTLGQNTSGVTFSQFALASKAGLLPAQDPKEAEEAVIKDLCTHVLQRIKHEGIPNNLIQPQDIPEKFELEVTIEPNPMQDDLRNAQVAAQLRQATDISSEWVNTNILKIGNSDEMFKQKAKEDIRNALLGSMLQDQVFMQELRNAALNKKPKPQANGGQTTPPPAPLQTGLGTATPTRPTFGEGGVGMEGMPQADAMIPPEERQ